jgi:hypothetical protein
VKVAQLLKKASSSMAQVHEDPSIRLTFYLLLGVLGLGVLSALVGYLFGHQSLKGVTQPDMNPFVNNSSAQDQFPRQGNFLLKESDIIAKIERETKGISKSNDAKKKDDKADSKKKDDKATTGASPSSSPSPAQPVGLPMSVKSQGLNLNIQSLSVGDNAIVLDVTLQNSGAQEVQFLYDFLEVSDDQSQFLSTEVKGLPTKFPAKSETFKGAIRILGVSPTSAKWISFSLADYPDQKIKLEIPKLLLK